MFAECCTANQHGRILVVEDNESLRELILLRLAERGYHVEAAAGGIEGLEAIRNKSAFDLAILDIKLPDLSGSQLLRYLQTESPQTEVIVISGYYSEELRTDAMANGAFVVFQKPFSTNDLVDLIDRLLEPLRRTT
jgi:two-component system nitrogen regulation response regulator GlnG